MSETLGNLLQLMRERWALEQGDSVIDGVGRGEWTQEASITAVR